MRVFTADDLARYRLAFDDAVLAWNLLAAHVWVRLAAALRRAHNVGLPDSFTGDPEIPRTFKDGCASFKESLHRLSQFEEIPADFGWLWCGGRMLTLAGLSPDLDAWLDSLDGVGPDEWQKSLVDPFMACARNVSGQFQAWNEHFQQAKEITVDASDNRAQVRLQISAALQRTQAEQKARQENRSQRRKRLYDLLTAATSNTQITKPVTEWELRLTAVLVKVGKEVLEQKWEDWVRASAEGRKLAQDFAELVLGGDQDEIARAVHLLPNLSVELEEVREWLKILARSWLSVFD